MNVSDTSLREYFRFLSEEEITDNSELHNCAICFEPLTDSPAVTHCEPASQHSFHRQCVIIWLMDHDECPSCRKIASWKQIATWSEWALSSSIIKWNIRWLQSLYDPINRTAGAKMGSLGAVVIFTGQFMDMRIIPPIGFFMQTIGIYAAQKEYYNNSLLPASEMLEQYLQNVQIAEKIYAISLTEARDADSQIKKAKLENRRNSSDDFQQKIKLLYQLRAEKKEIASKSSEKLRTLHKESQRIANELSSNQLFHKILVTVQYAFLCYSIFLLYGAVLIQKD